jgi:predicted transcriptional regulator
MIKKKGEAMFKRSELSECELTTMKCIWDAKEPVPCIVIMDMLRDEYGLNYKDTTVYTFLKNLKDKGFVASYRKGLTYFYPIRDEEEFRNEQLKKTENFWFNGSSSKLMSALFKMKEMTQDEKDELKRMIDELDK